MGDDVPGDVSASAADTDATTDTTTAVPSSVTQTYTGKVVRDNATAHYGNINGNVNNNFYNVTYEIHKRRSLEIGDDEWIGIDASIRGLQWQCRKIQAQFDAKRAIQQVGSLPKANVLDPWIAPPGGWRDQIGEFQSMLDQLKQSLTLPKENGINARHLVVLLSNVVILFDDFQTYLETGAFHTTEQLQAWSNKLHEQNAAWEEQEVLLSSSFPRSRDPLDHRVDQLLVDNVKLQARMSAMEIQLQYACHRMSVELQHVPLDTTARASLAARSHNQRSSFLDSGNLDFTSALEGSRPYRGAQGRSQLYSLDTFDSSVLREHGWTELDELSLKHTSVISVIALPITVSDLQHGEPYLETGAEDIRPSLDYIREDEEHEQPIHYMSSTSHFTENMQDLYSAPSFGFDEGDHEQATIVRSITNNAAGGSDPLLYFTLKECFVADDTLYRTGDAEPFHEYLLPEDHVARRTRHAILNQDDLAIFSAMQ